MNIAKPTQLSSTALLTFIAITLFYFFEYAQMTYFNVLAPFFLSSGVYYRNQIAALSSAYYYGDLIGLLPVGFFLDRFNLRKVMLWAIVGSVISAFVLVISKNYYLELVARFCCGFFGGTFSFVGGIRVLAHLFPHRFTLFIGIFLAAGMFGGLVCQYPLLLVVNHIGIDAAMMVMAAFGILVILFNLIYLHPLPEDPHAHERNKYPGTVWQMCLEIGKSTKNWCDCIMVVLLNVPTSIIGSLWGIVLLTSFYHFSAGESAWIIMCLFAGLIIGLPLFGAIADRFNYPAWLVILGSGLSLLSIVMMLVLKNSSSATIALLFFALGFFSSCQSVVFTWLTKDMRPELIGRNTAFNSMVFMGSGGALKQIGATLLGGASLIAGISSSGNLLIFAAIAMLITTVYAASRKMIFN
jgi:MFS family permease